MATSFKVLFLETTAALITSAFGLVAALAWNEAIKAAIAQWLSADDEVIGLVIGLVIYALIVTVIAVVATLLIALALAKAKGLVGARFRYRQSRQTKRQNHARTPPQIMAGAQRHMRCHPPCGKSRGAAAV